MSEISPTSARARERIRAAAIEQFRTRGYWATTMDHIRAAANLSRGGLYYQYSSTEQILSDLMTQERMHDSAGLDNSGPALDVFLAEQKYALLQVDDTLRPIVYEYVLGLPVHRRRKLLTEQFRQAQESIEIMLPGISDAGERSQLARQIVRQLEGLSIAAIAGVLTESDIDRDLDDVRARAQGLAR
jgi:AcrR family transcriptional regulator